LNAKVEFSQFFDEFNIIFHYLDEWQKKADQAERDGIASLHRQLRSQCETFIKRHMLLIQQANPRSQAAREGRSTWLRKVPFNQEQIMALFRQINWPQEREEVAKLHKKLMVFLEVATHSLTVENRDLLLEIRYVESFFCI
jgi:hypothetical protein